MHRGLRGALLRLARPLARRVGANPVSAARAVFALPVIAALLAGRAADAGVAFYLAGWFLDLLDGAIAEERRRLGHADDPDLGELVDTVADKLLLIPVLLALLLLGDTSGGGAGLLASAVLGLVAVAETWLLLKRVVDYRALRRSYRPMPSGKLKVWFVVAGTALLLASFPRLGEGPALAGLALLALSLPFSAVSIRAKLAESRAARS